MMLQTLNAIAQKKAQGKIIHLVNESVLDQVKGPHK